MFYSQFDTNLAPILWTINGATIFYLYYLDTLLPMGSQKNARAKKTKMLGLVLIEDKTLISFLVNFLFFLIVKSCSSPYGHSNVMVADYC